MIYQLRPIELHELNMIFNKMKCDFPRNERAPFSAIRSYIKQKKYEGFILERDGEAAAYCVNSFSHIGGYYLVSYLAVYKEFRGQGVGTSFMDKIKRYYADAAGIVVEVEPPLCEEARKRVSFYKKAGFILLEDIPYKIFGVKMDIMFWSGTQTPEYMRENIKNIIKSIYYTTLPAFLRGQVSI